MNGNYASHRRKLLAFESKALPGPGLIVASPRDVPAEGRRQTALAVPESVRTLGEPLEPFFEACGGRQTISLAVRPSAGRSPAETYVFQQPFVVIGRCRESDLPLADRTVDFRHLYLQLIAGRWMFLDLGMIARGKGAAERRPWGWFDSACEVAVGAYTIARAGDAAAGSNAPPPPAEVNLFESLPAVGLEFLTEHGSSQEQPLWPIDGVVSLVGASRHCQLSLRDDSVSKVHASFVLTPRGLWVVDLLGRGSVLVNGRPAYWKQIHDGALLQIGRYRFRARFGAQSGTSAESIGAGPAAEPLPAVERQTAPLAGMSESAVADLVRHMTSTQSRFFEHMSDMQARFLEHSRNQTQFMLQVLAQMSHSREPSVREDVARVERISTELEELKLQLARLPAPAPARKPRKKKRASQSRTKRPKDRPASEAAAPQSIAIDPTAASTPPASPPQMAPPPGSVPPFTEPQPAAPPAAKPLPVAASVDGGSVDAAVDVTPAGNERLPGDRPLDPAESADVHARLTQRMARLAQERNATWRRILAAFTGSSRNRSGS